MKNLTHNAADVHFIPSCTVFVTLYANYPFPLLLCAIHINWTLETGAIREQILVQGSSQVFSQTGRTLITDAAGIGAIAKRSLYWRGVKGPP